MAADGVSGWLTPANGAEPECFPSPVQVKATCYPLLRNGRGKGSWMLGRLVPCTWRHDPTLYAPARYRAACHYDAFIPRTISDLAFELPGEVAGVVSDAENAIRTLNEPAGSALAPLARLLLRTESIASSKVEGLQVDARSLARAESHADLGARVSTTAGEVLANIDAMQLAVEDATSAASVSVEEILAIHRVLLTMSSRPEIAGQIRTTQNWIGGNDYNPCGAAFVPPPPREVEALVDDLCAFCNAELLPPMVQAAVAHAQFETIHPFIDGNGRTGRALVQVLLRRRRLAPSYVPPISIVLAADKAAYIEGLTMYRNGDVAGWIERFSAAAARAAGLAKGYLTDVGDLQRSWRERLTKENRPRSDAAAWAVIDVLPGYPMITVSVAVAATARTKPAVNQAFAQLAEAGVLIPLGDSRRNRVWEAAGLLDMLADLDAAAAT
jgi:Fic family protein